MKMSAIHITLCSLLILLVGCSKRLDGRERGAQMLFVSTDKVHGWELWRRSDEIRDKLLAGGQLEAKQPSGHWVLYGTSGGPYQNTAISLNSYAHGQGIMVACSYSFLHSKDADALKARVAAAIGDAAMRNIDVSTYVEPIFPRLGDGAR